MAQTYDQIQQKIERLQTQAKALLAVEAKGVIDRIKEAIAHYDLTAEQLGFGCAKESVGTIATASTPTSPAKLVEPTFKSKAKPLFSDQSGNAWGGRGPRPAWLREALQAGHDINEFRIGKRAKQKKNLVPQSAAIAAASPADASLNSTAPADAPRRAKVSYGEDAGHTWSGMGPKPAWLKAAIESGKSLRDFAL